jgi:hypothetical protein
MTPDAGRGALAVRVLRTLALQAPAVPGGRPYMAAASGLVRAGGCWHVVADDELHLGVFAGEGADPGHLVRLLPGELPAAPRPRKKQKPDLEALVRLPALPGLPHGSLLALGSGSKAGRMTGALLPLSAESHAGQDNGPAEPVDLAGLYRELANHFSRVNIEGAAVVGEELWLLQRGNQGNVGANALIRLPLRPVLHGLAESRTLGAAARMVVQPSRLGTVRGAVGPVPLCFTDGAALSSGGLAFTAVAEDTEDPVNDGPCVASAIGCLGADGELRWLRELAGKPKVEGIDVVGSAGDTLELRLVTDADDPTQPAHLLAVAAGP